MGDRKEWLKKWRQAIKARAACSLLRAETGGRLQKAPRTSQKLLLDRERLGRQSEQIVTAREVEETDIQVTNGVYFSSL